jgi:hypothetical protein
MSPEELVAFHAEQIATGMPTDVREQQLYEACLNLLGQVASLRGDLEMARMYAEHHVAARGLRSVNGILMSDREIASLRKKNKPRWLRRA